MKTKKLLKTTGLTIMIMLLTTLFTNAQIPVQGVAADHEGIACWDADGTGPEPAGYGHNYPTGPPVGYYGSSRDYDGIDPDPDAAMCHFLDNITGFPLFVQALADNGYNAGQVKVKASLYSMKDDIEGEDWFTIGNMHYFNRYDGYYFIELNGESMISGYTYYIQSLVPLTGPAEFTQSFSSPVDASENSSPEVQDVAAAFLADIDGQELRFIMTNMLSTNTPFDGNGRFNSDLIDINSGYLEKGLQELPSTSLNTNHEGLACWNADGTGPEPEAYGHTFWYGGTEWWTPYYIASRDYDDIDPDPEAALCHLVDNAIGFPNLEIQLAYRGFTLDQLKVKYNIVTMGNDIEDEDWGLNGNIHWYHYYNNIFTIEIANEPILECVMDTSYGYWDMDHPYDNWWSYTNYAIMKDISANSSSDAQYVAASFLKDLGGHSIKSFSEGNFDANMPLLNGRDGVFHYIESRMEAKLPAGRLIWENEIKDTLYLDQSPYIFMDYCEVPDGEKLFIEPGVVVKFNSMEFFVIYGCIEAEGAEQLPILFTANDPNIPWGGMVWNETPITNDTSRLKHCIFEYAYGYGEEYGSNCGGAIGIDQVEKIKISHCIFRFNSADKFTGNNPAGGAIAVGKSSIHISHCIFHDNSGSWGGALAILDNSDAIIDNCLFYENESTYIGGGGGAVLVWSECSPHFVNCTFANNHAVDVGGAVELEFGGETTFTNCVFWGNTADNGPNQISIWVVDPPSLNVYYSDVEDGLNGIEPGFTGDYIGNIDADPEFMGTGEEFPYALNEASPCINFGILDPLYLPPGWACPAYCLCGNPRVYGWEIDMGCYETLVTGNPENSDYESHSFNIIPNPINSNPTIDFYLDNNAIVNISILDIHGRVLSETLIPEMKSGKNQVTLNIEKMSSGIYFCRLQIENKAMIKKVIKLN